VEWVGARVRAGGGGAHDLITRWTGVLGAAAEQRASE